MITRNLPFAAPLVRTVVLAIAGALLLAAAPTHAEDATTTRECYRSIRQCQKSRCKGESGQTQVSCMRECNREYETCVGGAGTGVFNLPNLTETPTKRERKRDLKREHP
jgi:hypothetical protein